jgi:4-phytase/acid phosphatase
MLKKSALQSVVLLALSIISTGGLASAHADEELGFVVILSRHGVRPPLWKPERLNKYSSDPWPKWDVPEGHLTAHGKKLMELFGAYDRAYFAKAGLVNAKGCEDAGRVLVVADSDERTVETGKALSRGMMPGCEVELKALSEGTQDPLFHSLQAGVGNPDPAIATAAVSGRIGDHPEALSDAHRHALDELERVLSGKSAKQKLLEHVAEIAPADRDKLVELQGPVATGATLAENLLLEYEDGMPFKDVGWGRANKDNLPQLLSLYTSSSDLLRRTPYIARARASNLMSHILTLVKQAVSGKSGKRVVFLVGHDTNISNVAGAMGLSWLLPGDVRDDTLPGGALVFELWRNKTGGAHSVRTYYMAQTLEQARYATALSLDEPPARAPIFVPACSGSGAGYPCEWKKFQKAVESAIEPGFVRK